MDLYRMKGILFFILYLFFAVSVPGRSERQLKAYMSGGILIFCKFDGQDKGRRKNFCKSDASTCQPVNDSRFFQYENAQRDYLTILITNLTAEDAGTYHCGVEDRHVRDPITLSVKSGDCCDSLIAITGEEGEDIDIDCKYPEESKGNIKHLCKQSQMNIESDLLQSKPSDRSKKYSQHDNKSASVVTVTIHKLDKSDAGIYWCGVRTGRADVALTRQVNLTIPVTGKKKKLVSMKGFTTGGILILCKFSNKDKHKQKYFCKGNLTTCRNNRLAHNNDSRFFQFDHDEHLTVLLTNLTTQDGGIYHCALEDGELHTAFSLKIKEAFCCDPPVSALAHEGENIAIQCKYPEESKGNVKHFCKQHEEFFETDLINSKLLHKSKYSPFDNKSGNVFTVTINNLEKNDAGIYWCGVRTGGDNVALTRQVNIQIADAALKDVKTHATYILVVVTAALLGVTLCTLCCRYRYRRKLGTSTGVTYHNTETPDPDGIYEEIKDTGPPAPLLTSSCTYTKMSVHQGNTGDPTYYTIESPPNLSDDTGLHLPSLETNP